MDPSLTAPDVCHEVAGHYIFSRALRRKNWRMRAAPWKSGPSGPRKPFGISDGFKPLWQRFVAQARFSAVFESCGKVPLRRYGLWPLRSTMQESRGEGDPRHTIQDGYISFICLGWTVVIRTPREVTPRLLHTYRHCRNAGASFGVSPGL